MDSSNDSRLKRRRKKRSLENTDLADLHRIEQEQKMVKDLLPGFKVCSTPSLFDACLQTDFPLDDKDTMSLHSIFSARGALSTNVSTHSFGEEDLPTSTDIAYLMPDFIGIKFSQKVHILLKDTKKTTTVTLNLDNMERDEIILKVSEWPIGDMYLWVEGYEIFPQRAPDLPYYITITTEYRKFSLEEAMLFGVDPQHAERERVAWRQRERRERRKQDSAGKSDKAKSILKMKSVQTQTLVQISPNIVTLDQSELFRQIMIDKEKHVNIPEGNLLEDLGFHKVKSKIPIPEATPSTSNQRFLDGEQTDNKRRKKVLDPEHLPSQGEIDSQLNHDLATLGEIIANFDSEIIKQAKAVDPSKTKPAIREAIEAINRLKRILYPPLAPAERSKLDPNEQEVLPTKAIYFAKDPQIIEEAPLQNDALGLSLNSGPSIGTSSQYQSEDTYEQSKVSMFSLESPDVSSYQIVRELGTSFEDPNVNGIPGPSYTSKVKQLEKKKAGSKSGLSDIDRSERYEVTSPDSGAFKPFEVSLAPITNYEQYQNNIDRSRTKENSHQLQKESAEKLDHSKPESSSPLSDLKIPQLESPSFASTDANSQLLERRKAASQIEDSFELPSSSITSIKSSQQTQDRISLKKTRTETSQNSQEIQNFEEALQESDSFLPLESPLLPPDSISGDPQKGRGPPPPEKSSLGTRIPVYSRPVPPPVPSQQFGVLVGPHLVPETTRPWPFVPPSLSRYYPRREVPGEQLCPCREGLCLGDRRPTGTVCRARLMDWSTPLVEVQRELMRPYVTSPPPAGPPPPPPPIFAPPSRPPMTAEPQDFSPEEQPSSSARK